jgi:hypothetical protein
MSAWIHISIIAEQQTENPLMLSRSKIKGSPLPSLPRRPAIIRLAIQPIDIRKTVISRERCEPTEEHGATAGTTYPHAYALVSKNTPRKKG